MHYVTVLRCGLLLSRRRGRLSTCEKERDEADASTRRARLHVCSRPQQLLFFFPCEHQYSMHSRHGLSVSLHIGSTACDRAIRWPCSEQESLRRSPRSSTSSLAGPGGGGGGGAEPLGLAKAACHTGPDSTYLLAARAV